MPTPHSDAGPTKSPDGPFDDAAGAPDPSPPKPKKRAGLLDAIEWVGNKLPDPAVLFLIGALIVVFVSWLAAPGSPIVPDGWSVQPKTVEIVTDPETGETVRNLVDKGDPLSARNLLSSEGIFWAFRTAVDNFINFPPLGVVLVGMLGIGVAERTGLIAAVLKVMMSITPASLLTPMVVFLGVMSSIAMDAGYVVLPPLAALLYKAVGRSPLAGIAAVFAGVSAGFNANFFVTGLDPMLAEFTNEGAQLVDPGYRVAATANWAFMIGSTFMATFVGWGVSHFLVEPRLEKKSPDDGGPTHVTESDIKAAQHIDPQERKGLGWALTALIATIAAFACLISIPGAPLNGKVDLTAAQTATITQSVLEEESQPLLNYEAFETALASNLAKTDASAQNPSKETVMQAVEEAAEEAQLDLPPDTQERIDAAIEKAQTSAFDRWIEVIEPLILLIFIIPGIAYGLAVKTITNSKDAAKLMCDAMAAMAPIIVLAFFAGQFIAYFEHSRLGTMLAMTGGEWLSGAAMPTGLLLILFILVTALFNLFVGSMSAKYALFAPIFVPMFMLVGVSPELTQATYRIGDSVSNIITPLNSYLVIILVFMQKYAPKSGIGTLISMMLPYTIVFTIAWSIMLLFWLHFELPVGLPPSTGPTEYIPSTAN